jgi:hypothetical protein
MKQADCQLLEAPAFSGPKLFPMIAQFSKLLIASDMQV